MGFIAIDSLLMAQPYIRIQEIHNRCATSSFCPLPGCRGDSRAASIYSLYEQWGALRMTE
jgi:hypothetical protein